MGLSHLVDQHMYIWLQPAPHKALPFVERKKSSNFTLLHVSCPGM
jgi:hypothetical protein